MGQQWFLSRAAWLQGRWLEISEQERRAQIKNQKLLQDFQRAQDTLNDMVARTEAMNTIRVQYEQYLEESFPRWQQRLKDIRVSEKSKHLKSYIQKMEEEEGIKSEHSSDFRAHLLSSNFPDASQPSHTMLNTHQRVKVTFSSPAKATINGPSVGWYKARVYAYCSLHSSCCFLATTPCAEPHDQNQNTGGKGKRVIGLLSSTVDQCVYQSTMKKVVKVALCPLKSQFLGCKNGERKKQMGQNQTLQKIGTNLTALPLSQDASDSNSGTKINKKHQKQFNKCNSKESVITEKTVDAVMQDEDEQEESKSQDISQSSVSSEKKDGSEGLNIRQEEDSNEGDDDSHDIIAAEDKISHREDKDEEEDEESTDGDEEAGFDDEAQGGDEEVMGKRDGTESSDREEPEREGDVPDDIPDMGETTEEEERDKSFQNTKEARKTQETVEDEREIHKSLEESEGEEGYNQETEDDEEEDDEVVVEKACAWSRDPFDDHTKCPEDDEDDIEGLLNPVNSQTQQEDDMKETDQSNDQPSDSEKDNLPQKSHPAATNEIVESDDGFDHFYD
ncbi:histone acetyltransferase KAT6B-like [Sinocyclocheilus anshuiensis]|uniref:histone acetyltransferase KAT6B-like n=1 Tax=Sinocyclocheilus anshuiensis TaxID=1608454 RepID=UPI0007B8759D|nr:PREDICTED: histone acetyltransferase KAT6B-like [Sinocyclocheilus anshuiensis]